MPIRIMELTDCFANAEEGARVVPSFRCLDIGADTPFQLMRLQAKEELTATPTEGVRHTSDRHVAKCRDALRLARAERADLFLTPEYCVPLDLITEMLEAPDLQPRPHSLWCLGCEGVSWDAFQDHIHRWGDKAVVGLRTLEDVRDNHFVNFLLYAFVSKEGDKLCLVPQVKLQRMSEPILVCEGLGLSLGQSIVRIGEDAENQLFSLLCADAFHPEVSTGSLFFENRSQRRYIVLHPQLNPDPRNPEIAGFRNQLFRLTSARETIYITANWAEGTTVRAEGVRPLTIETPWSSIYRRFVSLDGEQHWVDRLRRIRILNLRRGLALGFLRTQKLKVWFANKMEHIQQISLSKPYDGGPEISDQRAGKVQVTKAYIPDAREDGWVESEISFPSELPASIAAEAAGEYAYPTTASMGDLDRFFGYCLGHMEKGQLYLTDRERSARLSHHVDKACESDRERDANAVARLIRCLKRKDRLPGQLKRLRGRFRLQLASPDFPFNVLPLSGNEEQGALAMFAERTSSMKQMVETIYRETPELRWLGDKVCVFSQDEGGQIIHYPEHTEDHTVPVKTRHSIEFTDGGAPLDAELD